jgi:hypothetical protein
MNLTDEVFIKAWNQMSKTSPEKQQLVVKGYK